MKVGCFHRKRWLFSVCFLSLAVCSYAWPWRKTHARKKALLVRGGSSDEATVLVDDIIDRSDEAEADFDSSLASAEASSQSPELSLSTREIKRRQSSDIIQDLITRSSLDGNLESQDLRNLITSRMEEYLKDVQDDSNEKLPHPKKLLHYLAPKIPAIRHSPDMALRIRSARSDMDCGVAAALIGILAHACEVYDGRIAARSKPDEKGHRRSSVSAAVDLVKDRRFEQLVECVLCGVDVKKRKKEYLQQQIDREANIEDIEVTLDEEDVEYGEGLSVRDACRVAWGFSVLGVSNRLESIGGEKVTDILVALSLQNRELLLARLQLLRRDDLYAEWENGQLAMSSIEERLEELSEEVAEDAASAMWTFACVRACTGVTSIPLLEVCCSILCQDPHELRRRAQDVEATLEATNVGSNDVVDRLAESEAGMSVEATSNITETKEDEPPSSLSDANLSHALIDWLSPKEATDVLWALAIHGSKSKENAVSKEEVALSNVALILREIAFDRVQGWLREELFVLDHHPQTTKAAAQGLTTGDKMTVEAVGETVVEVVDAAALLASENAAKADDFPHIDRYANIDSSKRVDNEQEVSFVDAESLLSAERDLKNVASNDLIPSSIILTESAEYSLSSDDPAPPLLSIADLHRFDHFDQHDVCSLAWAVTELGDPLRHSIVDLISTLFYRIGMNGMSDLNGADLSNLAWAIAKHATEDDMLIASASKFPPMLLMEWISQKSMVGMSNQFDSGESDVNDILHRFEPSELSRLMWAIASIQSCRNEVNDSTVQMDIPSNLALVGLLAAASNMEIFGTEDLARIVWAFLEVSDLKQVLNLPFVADALGKVLSTVEISLLKWENESGSSADSADGHSAKESTRIPSFFGRSRFHASFLDHKNDESEEVDEFHLRSRLPLLRNLPIDPSTMCKAASSFARLTSNYAGIGGSETLLRIALRLLTSRSGRLLRGCPRQDIIRLCEAVAVNESVLGRELIGSFVRRVVHLLNESDEESAQALSSLPPQDFATLVWSLGELCVKHHPKQDDISSAHRRLQLVQELPVLSEDQIGTLSSVSVSRLVSFLVNLSSLHPAPFTDPICLLTSSAEWSGFDERDVQCQSISSRFASLSRKTNSYVSRRSTVLRRCRFAWCVEVFGRLILEGRELNVGGLGACPVGR